MFNAKYDNPLDTFVIENPGFTRTDLENQLSSLGIYTGKTPDRSINRDVLKYIRKNYPEFEKLTTKEVKESKDERVQEKLDGGDLPPGDDIQWRRKLLKTGQTSNPKWKTSTNIEIYTFINSDDSKFDSDLYDELFEAVQKKIPFLTEIDSDGYSDNLVDEYEIDSSFIYPTANLIISGTKYTIELK